jgi:hypothetical protein
VNPAGGAARHGLARRAVLGGLALAAGAPWRDLAQAATKPLPLDGPSVAEAVARMKPGDFLWAPEVAPEGPVLIVVSLKTQRAYVYRNGLPIGISTVSTGKAGHETPTGVFTVLQKRVDHKSNLYANAPMPYMQRLTWDGIAMHAGNLPGYPASHGCIRLPMAFARRLYAVTRLGLTVAITPEAEVPRVAPAPAVLGAAKGPAAGDGVVALIGGTLWQPERAPSGPLSIVISTADRRLLVLRNGVAIGSAPIELDGEIEGMRAYTLRAVDGGGPHWMRLSLPGQEGAPDAEVTAEERGRLRLPEAFRRSLAAILTPGTTVVVTRDTLQSGSAGRKLTVMTGG